MKELITFSGLSGQDLRHEASAQIADQQISEAIQRLTLAFRQDAVLDCVVECGNAENGNLQVAINVKDVADHTVVEKPPEPAPEEPAKEPEPAPGEGADAGVGEAADAGSESGEGASAEGGAGDESDEHGAGT